MTATLKAQELAVVSKDWRLLLEFKPNQKPDSSNSGFNKLVINVQDMNYSFKVLGCEFTYLGEIK